MAIDTSLPISNKGTNGSPITDSGGNPVQGVEVTLWRRVLNDTNSDGEGDGITDTKLLARTQTDSNGEYEFTESDVPGTYEQGNSEVIYYCTVHALSVEAGSGDPLDNGRIKSYPSDNEPAASDYMVAYSLEAGFPLVVDDFNDGDLSEYTVAGGDIFGVNTSNPIEGSGTLETTATSTTPDGDLLMSNGGDGLNAYPSKGDVFSFLVYEPGGSNTLPQVGFGGDRMSVTGYVFLWLPTSNEIRIRKITSQGSSTDLALDSDIEHGNYVAEAVEVEVEWHDGSGSEPDNTIVARVYEIDSNLNRVGQIGSKITAMDPDYSSQTGVFYTIGSSAIDADLFLDRYQIKGEV